MQDKIDFCAKILEEGSLFIHINPMVKGVILPTKFKLQEDLIIKFGLDAQFQNLSLELSGIRGMLAFKSVFLTCFIPWDAMITISNGEDKSQTWDIKLPKYSNVVSIETAKTTKIKGNHLKFLDDKKYL